VKSGAPGGNRTPNHLLRSPPEADLSLELGTWIPLQDPFQFLASLARFEKSLPTHGFRSSGILLEVNQGPRAGMLCGPHEPLVVLAKPLDTIPRGAGVMLSGNQTSQHINREDGDDFGTLRLVDCWRHSPFMLSGVGSGPWKPTKTSPSREFPVHDIVCGVESTLLDPRPETHRRYAA